MQADAGLQLVGLEIPCVTVAAVDLLCLSAIQGLGSSVAATGVGVPFNAPKRVGDVNEI